MNNKNIIWIDNARIYAIFAVVILHISSGVVKGMSPYESYGWWIGNFYDSLTRWSVPVFVMISGFLLLVPKVDENIQTFYKKRVSKIFIPLIFWSVFYLLFDSINSSLSSYDIAKRILFGIPYYHMWFIYMIIGLYLFTPFLRKLFNTLSFKELKNLIIIFFTLIILNNLFDYFVWKNMNLFFNLFVEFIPYFLLGGMMRKFNYIWNIKISMIVFVMSVILTIIGCYFLSKQVNLYNGLYFYNYLSLTVIPMSISGIMLLQRSNNVLVNKNIIRKVSFLSFGIYLIHPLIINMFTYFGIYAKDYNSLFSIPIIATLVFLISLGFAFILHLIPILKRVI